MLKTPWVVPNLINRYGSRHTMHTATITMASNCSTTISPDPTAYCSTGLNCPNEKKATYWPSWTLEAPHFPPKPHSPHRCTAFAQMVCSPKHRCCTVDDPPRKPLKQLVFTNRSNS